MKNAGTVNFTVYTALPADITVYLHYVQCELYSIYSTALPADIPTVLSAGCVLVQRICSYS